MDNPFQLLTDAFHPQYRVNFSIESLDGCVMLTLSDARGAVIAKRRISAEQRRDPKRLHNLIQSVQFGIAIDQGQAAREVLDTLSSAHLGRPLKRVQLSPGSPSARF
ncbi:DUF3509 domain-containing protein [Pseudomonas sp. UL073]|uniref:DUF3509 domain-containing protein n=1 Tax=Zestomonas insulae TaxID=2809017 RepID=A0ABS2IAT5_9GAMM|nr:DUF3509 domain-containing protein [Pseudomonas insulae]MBM7060077.1 DUF3509 domain-containing protein [Pseudomonas insulae]